MCVNHSSMVIRRCVREFYQRAVNEHFARLRNDATKYDLRPARVAKARGRRGWEQLIKMLCKRYCCWFRCG